MYIFVLRQVRLESLCQFAPGEQDAAPAALALEADIRAEARHRPFVRAAGMLFSQAEVIVESQVGEHKNRVIRKW
jgi:hypothetical protein